MFTFFGLLVSVGGGVAALAQEVGIGTTVPAVRLDIQAPATYTNDLLSVTHGTNVYLIVTNAGRVGVGTNLPDEALDVVGNVEISDPGSGVGVIRFYSANNVNTTPDMWMRQRGLIVADRHLFLYSDGNGDGIGDVYLGAGATNVAAGTDHVTVKGGNGRVGIGTVDPVDRFHMPSGRMVLGNMGPFAPSDYDMGAGPNFLVLSGGNRDVALASYAGPADGSKADIDFVRGKGTVASPQNVDNNTELGVVNFAMYHGGQIRWRKARMYAIVDGTPASNDYPTRFEFWTTARGSANPTRRLVIRHNGRVGIGTASPNQLLTVNGNASKPGGGSWATFSDRRLKKEIHPFTYGLEVLEKIQPVWYTYNRQAVQLMGESDYLNRRFVGVVAQDLQRVAPFMVETSRVDDLAGQTHHYLSVDPSAFDFLLINAVKELAEKTRRIDELEQRLAEMEQTLYGRTDDCLR